MLLCHVDVLIMDFEEIKMNVDGALCQWNVFGVVVV